MNENLRLERVGALIRSRIVTWSGYRGWGRRPDFLDKLLKLTLYLAKKQNGGLKGAFPCDRRALAAEQFVGLPPHSIRRCLKALVDLGMLHPASSLSRKLRSVHYKPNQFEFCAEVQAIFSASGPEPVRALEKEQKVRPAGVFRAARRAVDAVKEANKALLRSMFRGDDAAWEAHWRGLPDR